MGFTKNAVIEQQIADSPAMCPNCKVNYDDKFMVLCAKHEAEREEFESWAEYEDDDAQG